MNRPAGPPWGVVHCVFSVAIGGQEMVILSLAEHADRSRFAPRVLCLNRAGELAPRFEALGIPVDVVERPVGGSAIQTLRAMRRYLRHHRPAILHTHNPTPHQYGALARMAAGVPVLIHTKHSPNPSLSAKGRTLERIANHLTDAVVAVSNDASRVAHETEGMPRDRVRVIHNGVDVSRIRRHQLHPGGWRAVHVARLNEVKDQATLLKAARLVLDTEPRFHLDIVGDGEMRPELERIIKELHLQDAVTIHGFRDDVQTFLDRADVFVLSSLSEGIAITLLEAMAAGLPVVATDVGGNREVVVPNETGLLVPPRNPVALAGAIVEVLSDPARAARLAAAGRDRVTESFSLEKMLQGYESLYLDLLGRRFGHPIAQRRERLDIRFRRGLIKLYEGGFKRRPVFRYWRELEASQWWPTERIAELQFERLRQMLLHAQATSPWYQETWRAGGLDARQMTAPADFLRWPVIDRDTVRAHRMAMRSTARGIQLIPKATGGSSGVPLQFDLDTDSNERRMAAWHRSYAWAGAAPGTRQWYLWGVPPTSMARWRKRKRRLYDALYRRTTESSFDLSEAAVPRFLESLRRTRPDVIVAYTSALYTFATMLEERGLVPFAPQSVVVGAEQLHGFQRTTIERVFRAPVFETYGSREFMPLGAECDRHAGLHLTAEQLLIEVLTDDGHPVAAGQEGNVVVTDLTNFGMPFIRYANGDRAVLGDGLCSCGRGLPLLRSVTGRRLDVLTTLDGRRLPGEFFPHILKDLRAVRRFQVVQEVPEAVTVRLVAPDWTPQDEAWFRREVSAAVGTGLRLDLELVEAIPLSAAGKLQVVINRLAMAQPPREQG